MCKLRKAFSEGPQKRLFLPEEISEIMVSAVEVETVTFGIPEPGVSNTFHTQGQGWHSRCLLGANSDILMQNVAGQIVKTYYCLFSFNKVYSIIYKL